MNHLASYASLHNRYFVMRHGESKANLKNKIISHEINAKSNNYGLTELGRQQVFKALRSSELNSATVIYSSDYTRAEETADIAKKVLKASDINLTPKLRERYFGEWELTSINNYKSIWEDDSKEKDRGNVESPEKVLDRVTELVVELEKKYLNKNILLISHGDTLQILQCGFQKLNPYKHRTLKHLGIAEIRQISLKAN